MTQSTRTRYYLQDPMTGLYLGSSWLFDATYVGGNAINFESETAAVFELAHIAKSVEKELEAVIVKVVTVGYY